MTRAKITDNPTRDGFVIKPHHDRILTAIYQYHFMTVEQVTRLFYRPGTVSTVRALLNALAVQKYLLSFHEPRPTPVGSTPKIYTLSLQGFNHLKKQGVSVPIRFREPNATDLEKNYLFLKHNLAVTDFLIAATTVEKAFPDVQLYEFLHERALKQQPPLLATIEKQTDDSSHLAAADGKTTHQTLRLYLDGFCDFRVLIANREKAARFCLFLELDRKTESEADIRRKIRGLLSAVKSGECFKRFGTRNPTVAFVNTVGGVHRREQLRGWAEAELKKTKEPKYWTEMFLFTDVPVGSVMDSQKLFLSPVWYLPFKAEPSVLIRVGHDKQYAVRG